MSKSLKKYGTVIIKANMLKTEANAAEAGGNATELFLTNVYHTEQYLNDTVATEIYKKFGLAVRFHL